MKVNLDCIPCFQRQALQAARFISNDTRTHKRVLREVMKTLLKLKWDSTPPEMAYEVHKIVRRLTKNKDPYKDVKKESNDTVLKVYPELKKKVEGSKDPLRTAIRLAIAGNIIDYGALKAFDLKKTIEEVLRKEFAIDDYEKFKEILKDAKTLLFFTDNAGEIGFDKLLVDTILKEKIFEKVRFVVKGRPIINDATIEDAIHMELDTMPNVELSTVSNGEAGTGPQRGSRMVKEWVEEHDLVISKGQANYEGLSEHHGIFFMLLAKCPIIAQDLGVNAKDIILRYRP